MPPPSAGTGDWGDRHRVHRQPSALLPFSNWTSTNTHTHTRLRQPQDTHTHIHTPAESHRLSHTITKAPTRQRKRRRRIIHPISHIDITSPASRVLVHEGSVLERWIARFGSVRSSQCHLLSSRAGHHRAMNRAEEWLLPLFSSGSDNELNRGKRGTSQEIGMVRCS